MSITCNANIRLIHSKAQYIVGTTAQLFINNKVMFF
jgi:hypothetical protein